MTAAIGMACGAGLALLAIAVTAGHFIVVFVYPRLAAALPRSRFIGFGIQVVYEDGRGILRDILRESTQLGFQISRVDTRHLGPEGDGDVTVTLEVVGQPSAQQLALDLNDLDGVRQVTVLDRAQGYE